MFFQLPQTGRRIPHRKGEMLGVVVEMPPVFGHDGFRAHKFRVGRNGGILSFQHGSILLAERIGHDESFIHRGKGVNECKELLRLLRGKFSSDFVNQRADHSDLMARNVVEQEIDKSRGVGEPDVPKRKKEFVRIEYEAQWLSPTA